MKIKEAIILAGGLGTRLRTALPDTPKCMAPVLGKPFLSYVIAHLQNQGIRKFIFALGYKSEIFEDFLRKTIPESLYELSVEAEPLGTGGAIKLACARVGAPDALVLNGDTFFQVDLGEITHFHELYSADCTITLKPMRRFDRYGVVEMNPDHSIRSFKEKKWYEQGLINGGVYALQVQKFLLEPLADKFSFEKDYLERFYSDRAMYGLIQDAYFIDIGIPEDYERAQSEFPDLKI